MSTPFQSALSAYLDAHLTYNRTWDEDNEGSGEATQVAERTLAHAGDVLEGELRRMMREEANAREARRAEDWLKSGGMVSQPRWASNLTAGATGTRLRGARR